MNNLYKSICSPKKFIVGKNLLNDPSKFVTQLGNNCLIISDKYFLETVKNETAKSLEKSNIKSTVERFNVECSKEEIERLSLISQEKKTNVIIGIGGGKTLDTAKAVAYYEKHPVIIIPTAASTDAPCTSLAVLYKKDTGEFDKYLYIPNNPDIVLADTDILVSAPPRLFSSGIGDALATYFEARTCHLSNGNNLVNMKPSMVSLGMAKLCYEIINDNIEKAIDSVNCKSSSQAFESMLEATIYLSGTGAESGGLAAAHAISNGLGGIKQIHDSHAQHGEKVAFGLLVQLVLENSPTHEIENVIRIIKIAKLPLTLEDLGYKNFNIKDIETIAEIANRPNDTMVNMLKKFDQKDIVNAILNANELGKRYKNK